MLNCKYSEFENAFLNSKMLNKKVKMLTLISNSDAIERERLYQDIILGELPKLVSDESPLGAVVVMNNKGNGMFIFGHASMVDDAYEKFVKHNPDLEFEILRRVENTIPDKNIGSKVIVKLSLNIKSGTYNDNQWVIRKGE